MKLFSSIFIFYIFLMGIQAIFKAPDGVSIEDYKTANTKIYNIESNHMHKRISRFFNINIDDVEYKIIIKPTAIKYLYDESTVVVLIRKNSTLRKNVSDYISYIVNGYIDGYPSCSSVEGYIQNDEYYGTIVFKNRNLYVANINRFPKIADLYKDKIKFNAVIYDQDSTLYENQTNLIKRLARSSNNISSPDDEKSVKAIYREFIEERHICSLYLLLDNSFLTIIHNNDVTAAAAQVMLSVREVNSLFRSTDFDEDGNPDNLGFIIKYLVILESAETSYNYMPPYSSQPVSPKHYLVHFAQYAILGEVCLGVLFTAQSFRDNVLGVSYSAVSESDITNDVIGGICQRPFTNYMLSLNAVAVSYVSTQGVHLSQNILDTCLAHELGHAFGCRHDRSSDPGYQEDYLMSSHTLPRRSVNNFQFSPLSKTHLVMTVPRKGQCMVRSTESFCGNGILENGEECDCGANYLCQLEDPCCIPTGQLGACQINRGSGFQCHPSQGLCCTSECRYKHLDKVGVDCTLLNKKCPCLDEYEECPCGIGGNCLGSKCQSEECARIGARECDCPSYVEVDSCYICCMANPEGPCLTSKNLTELQLAKGSVTIEHLGKFNNTSRILPNITEYKKVCLGIECVTLAFRDSKVGDFCLNWGKLGICTAFGCSMEKRKPFGPAIMPRGFNMKSTSWDIMYSVFLIYCPVFILVIN